MREAMQELHLHLCMEKKMQIRLAGKRRRPPE
jgi:hypothetical protein